ncbi:MAG: hypothetical protein K6E38_08795, partial [Fretibacterium sp.]|nr:hypothetical protein [Fretibacterium sp.]
MRETAPESGERFMRLQAPVRAQDARRRPGGRGVFRELQGVLCLVVFLLCGLAEQIGGLLVLLLHAIAGGVREAARGQDSGTQACRLFRQRDYIRAVPLPRQVRVFLASLSAAWTPDPAFSSRERTSGGFFPASSLMAVPLFLSAVWMPDPAFSSRVKVMKPFIEGLMAKTGTTLTTSGSENLDK